MKNWDTRLMELERKTRAHQLQKDKAYFHSLSDVELTALLSQASELDRELVCLIMTVSEAELMQATHETGLSQREIC